MSLLKRFRISGKPMPFQKALNHLIVKMHSRLVSLLALSALLATAQAVLAQANLPIYTDNLVNAFQDWG
jgi:hypothetical protein